MALGDAGFWDGYGMEAAGEIQLGFPSDAQYTCTPPPHTQRLCSLLSNRLLWPLSAPPPGRTFPQQPESEMTWPPKSQREWHWPIAAGTGPGGPRRDNMFVADQWAIFQPDASTAYILQAQGIRRAGKLVRRRL